jgi:carboxyl-terminal processing protease
MSRRLPVFLLLVLWSSLVLPVAAAPTEKSPPAKGQAKKEKEDYYELYKLLSDTVDQVDRNYVKEVDRRELIEAAIRGVLSKLDPYSNYISPEELDRFRSSVESEFGGIGIQLSADDGDLRVLSPMYGTPAYRAGVLAGDRIVEIDGKSADGLSLDEAIARMKGPTGTSVTLTVVHLGKPGTRKFTLKREIVHVETVLGDHRKPDDTWDFMLDPQARIGYIRVSAFSRETAKELHAALKDLKSRGLRGLVLDLRFNPGGLLSSAIEVSGLFISQGRIVSTKGRNTAERTWDARKEGSFGQGVFEGFPMVVLVNRYSASASEIVSACLQDHQRAVVMGERTWGKGSVQNIIELEGGKSALKLTTAAYCRPSGKNIHRFPNAKDSDEWGVMPDKGYELKLNEREIVALLDNRRDRDVLLPHDTPAGRPEAAKPVPTKPEAAKPEASKPAGPAKTDVSKPEVAKPVEKPKPNETAKPEAGAKPPAVNSTAGKPSPFVDRQLELAVKYLSTEMARAK